MKDGYLQTKIKDLNNDLSMIAEKLDFFELKYNDKVLKIGSLFNELDYKYGMLNDVNSLMSTNLKKIVFELQEHLETVIKIHESVLAKLVDEKVNSRFKDFLNDLNPNVVTMNKNNALLAYRISKLEDQIGVVKDGN